MTETDILPVTNTESQSYSDFLGLTPDSPEFKPISEARSFKDLEKRFHVFFGPDGRKHIPLSVDLITLALKDDQNEVNYQEIKSIYDNLEMHWRNLQEVDFPFSEAAKEADQENQKYESEKERERERKKFTNNIDVGMRAHSERVAHHVFMFYAIYLLKLRDQSLDLENLTEETLQDKMLTVDEIKIAARATLAALGHDFGKSTVIGFDEHSNKIFKHQDTLLSKQKRTDDQIRRMLDHPQEGSEMLITAGLPRFFADVAANHHSRNFIKTNETIASSFYATRATEVYDQFDAAISIRTYKDAKRIAEMHNDQAIVNQLHQLEESGDALFGQVYNSTVRILTLQLGEDFNQIGEDLRLAA